MMVNYDYYSNVYYGNIVDNHKDFNRLARRASNLVDKHTFNRALIETDKDLIEDIKLTICEVIDTLFQYDEIKNVSQKTNDKWSISYNNDRDLNKSVREIVRNNLLHSGLLYRGV